MINAGEVIHSTLLGEEEVLTLFPTLITLLSLDLHIYYLAVFIPLLPQPQRRKRRRQNKYHFYPR